MTEALTGTPPYHFEAVTVPSESLDADLELLLPNGHEDPVLASPARLRDALAKQERRIVIARDARAPVALLSAICEPANGLAKLQRLIFAPKSSDLSAVARDALEHGLLEALTRHLSENPAGLSLLYGTTRTLTLAQLRTTLELGYRVLGTFPHAPGTDPSGLNGMTAYYLPGALDRRQHARLRIHPAVLPLYSLVHQDGGLREAITPVSADELSGSHALAEFDPLPPVELIEAPRFAARRFERLRARHFLANDFYPFQEPNALVTDPDERIEVFLRLLPEYGFATLIGERIDLPIHPTELYARVASIVESAGILYLEVLCDAGDAQALDFIIRAGFRPCAYVPAFKPHANQRRDYVILSRTTDRRPIAESAVSAPLLRFWQVM